MYNNNFNNGPNYGGPPNDFSMEEITEGMYSMTLNGNGGGYGGGPYGGHHGGNNNQHNNNNRCNKVRTRPCKFFLSNKCNRGANCNFAHVYPRQNMGVPNRFNNKNSGNMMNNGPPPPNYGNFNEGRRNNHRGSPRCDNMGYPPMNFYQDQQWDDAPGRGNYMHPEMRPPTISVEEVRGRVYALSRTQVGCRQLQRLLDKDGQAWRTVYEELKLHFKGLVTDSCGHHLCIRLLEFIKNPELREPLLSQLQSDLIQISLSVHGTRVVQKMLEVMSSEGELRIVQDSLKMYVITLAKDVYGMHVILRCLHRMPPPGEDDKPSNQFIFDEITKNIVGTATHKHGCCVVQWCIDYATPAQRKKLVNQIVNHSLELAQDAFGNYVVQQIMDPTHSNVLPKLVTHLSGSITRLAAQKFSSIVIEKCLEYTEPEQQMQIITELVNPEKLPHLLQDPYANYVIQKALSVTRQENFQEVVSIIRPHLQGLSNTPFGKRIKTQMVRRFPILSMGPQKATVEPAQQTPGQPQQMNQFYLPPTEI